MSTAIEKLLFRSYGTHGVKSISFRENALTLVVAPWAELENELEANFSHARLDYIQSRDPEPGGLEFPWDIIAIDCADVANGRWKFVLTCQAIEISFSAQWPEHARWVGALGMAAYERGTYGQQSLTPQFAVVR